MTKMALAVADHWILATLVTLKLVDQLVGVDKSSKTRGVQVGACKKAQREAL